MLRWNIWFWSDKKQKKEDEGKEYLRLLMYSLSQVVQYHWQKLDKDSKWNHASQRWEKRYLYKSLIHFPNTCGVLHTYSTFEYTLYTLYSKDKRKWIKRRDRQRRSRLSRWRPNSERRYSPRSCLHLTFYSISAGHCVTLMHLQNFMWSSGLCLDSVLFLWCLCNSDFITPDVTAGNLQVIFFAIIY